MKISRCLFALIFCCSAIFAQTNDATGFIVGQITERTTGQPIAGARGGVQSKVETVSDAAAIFVWKSRKAFMTCESKRKISRP